MVTLSPGRMSDRPMIEPLPVMKALARFSSSDRVSCGMSVSLECGRRAAEPAALLRPPAPPYLRGMSETLALFAALRQAAEELRTTGRFDLFAGAIKHPEAQALFTRT